MAKKTTKPYSNRTNSYKRKTTTTEKTKTKKTTTPKKTATPKKEVTPKSSDLKSEKLKELEVLEKKLEETTRIRVDKERIEDTANLDTSFLEGRTSRSKKNKNILKEEIIKDDFEAVEEEIDIPFSDINLEETKEIEKTEEKKETKKKKNTKKEMPDFLLDDVTFSKSKLDHDNKIGVIDTKEKEKKPVGKIISMIILGILVLALFVMGMLALHHVLTMKPEVKYKTKKIVETKIDDNYLFLGDSITDFYDLEKYYPKMHVVNSGVNANKINDILEDMDKRVYQYNPSKVFILIGTNDILDDKDASEISSGIKEIIDGIQDNRPYAEIYVESIYPVNDTEDEKIDLEMVNVLRDNDKIKNINKEIKKVCKEKKVKYIDMYSALVDDNDKLNIDYTTEGLHLNNEGYKVVTDELMKYIKK